MFNRGGMITSRGTGITSGLDRKGYKDGTDEYDRALKTTERFMTDIDKFRGGRAIPDLQVKSFWKNIDADGLSDVLTNNTKHMVVTGAY